jgi:hypothetical protein
MNTVHDTDQARSTVRFVFEESTTMMQRRNKLGRPRRMGCAAASGIKRPALHREGLVLCRLRSRRHRAEADPRRDQYAYSVDVLAP